MFNKLKKFLRSKRAIGSVGTAIKVVTACVLGATILVGGVALTNDVILPSTSDKTQAIADYEGGKGSSTGGVTPVSTPVASTITFTIDSTEYTADNGMTWAEWCNSAYNTIELYYDTDDGNGGVIHSDDTVVLTNNGGVEIVYNETVGAVTYWLLDYTIG